MSERQFCFTYVISEFSSITNKSTTKIRRSPLAMITFSARKNGKTELTLPYFKILLILYSSSQTSQFLMFLTRIQFSRHWTCTPPIDPAVYKKFFSWDNFLTGLDDWGIVTSQLSFVGTKVAKFVKNFDLLKRVKTCLDMLGLISVFLNLMRFFIDRSDPIHT